VSGLPNLDPRGHALSAASALHALRDEPDDVQASRLLDLTIAHALTSVALALATNVVAVRDADRV